MKLNDKKVDRRIIKTKDKISKTLFSILKEKPLSDITISYLCEKADISRATFYNNFEVIENVLVYSIEKIFDDISYEFDRRSRIVPDKVKTFSKCVASEIELHQIDFNSIINLDELDAVLFYALYKNTTLMCEKYFDLFGIQGEYDLSMNINLLAGPIASTLLMLLKCGDKYTLEEKEVFIFDGFQVLFKYLKLNIN